MNAKAISVLLIDDFTPIRAALKLIFSKSTDFMVTGETGNGNDGVKLAIQLKPDVVIMDLHMRPLNGYDTTRQILKELPQTVIIGFSSNKSEGYQRQFKEVGGKVLLPKEMPVNDLLDTIRTIYWDSKNSDLS